MNNLQKIALVFVFIFVFTISAVVSADSYDFQETQIASTLEEANRIKEEQQSKADEYSKNLERCSYLAYESTITPVVETLDTITKETAKEKDAVKSEKEKEGYIVTVVTKEHDAQTNEYTFNVLNGIVTSSLVNEQDDTSYNKKQITEVLSGFENVDNDDIRIEITTSNSETKINKTETKKTEKEAKDLVKELEELGYEVSYSQNSNTKIQLTKSSKTALTKENITESLKSENPTKEILDVTVSTVSTPSKVSETFDTEEKATLKYNELKSAGIYENVTKTKVIDYTKAEKVSDGKFEWEKESTEPYNEDIYTDGEKTGYKTYYAKTEIISEAQNKKEENLTEAQCKKLLNSHSAKDGWTSNCEKTTSTKIEESTDNKVHMNSTPQGTRTWSHLDISIGQHINIIDKEGNVLASNIQGTLKDIEVTLNGTTKIEYNQPTYDGSRLEVRQKTSKVGYTKVTNTDLVTINATITYTYNGVKKTKAITIEGYLHNIYNVCREKNIIGGGYDLEFDIILDTDNNLITEIKTETLWTFTASKEAETKLQGYYEEYEYAKNYKVEAIDEDYVYNVSYIATDYNILYKGIKSVYNVIEKIYDKFYLISGEKTTYEVKTVGNIKEDNQCKETLPGSLIVNYITKDGKVLTKRLESTEPGTTPYETIEKVFDGYRLIRVEGNKTGKYIAGETIEVTYIYEEIKPVSNETQTSKVPTVNTGINETNIYEYILIGATITLIGLLSYRKRLLNR